MSGAGNETRTRDLNLGKVALYQLSYSRIDVSMVGTSNEARIIAKERRAPFMARATLSMRTRVGSGRHRSNLGGSHGSRYHRLVIG